MHDNARGGADLEFRMLNAVRRYTAIGKEAIQIPNFPDLKLVPRLHREALILDSNGKLPEAVPMIERAVVIFDAIVRAFQRNPDRNFRLVHD